MTILVGVKCKDGIVIGADSKATSAMGQSPLVQLQSNDKLQLVGNRGLIATTGSVGLSQRLKAILDRMWGAKEFRGECLPCVGKIAQAAVQDFQSTGVPRTNQAGLGFGGLFGMIFEDQPYLIEFGTTDFQPEIKRDKLFFVSMGSGQVLADPFLAFVSRVLWKNAEPDVDMAKMGVFWVLNHTIQFAPGGVGEPIKLGVIKRERGDWKATVFDDTDEQAEFIGQVESRIGPDLALSDEVASLPPKP